MMAPGSRATVRSMRFSSSRTFPGHAWASRTRIASVEIFFSGIPCSVETFFRKCRTRRGMSSRRSRSGGIGSGMTAIR